MPATRFQTRYVAAPRLPIRYSVARTPVKNGFPTMPLYADDRAAISNPSLFFAGSPGDPEPVPNPCRDHGDQDVEGPLGPDTRTGDERDDGYGRARTARVFSMAHGRATMMITCGVNDAFSSGAYMVAKVSPVGRWGTLSIVRLLELTLSNFPSL